MAYLIDLHCHTKERSFDGRIEAAAIVRGLVAAGFSGVVFTDHSHVWPVEDMAALREATNCGPDFFLASGQEVRAAVDGITVGDVLVYGPTVDLPDGTEMTEVLRLIDESQGFAIAAHPGVPRIGLGSKAGDFPILAAEVWNGRYGRRIAEESERVLAEIPIVWVGGSDTHDTPDIAGGGTEFAELPTSLAHLKRLIASEQCRPWRPNATERLKRWLMKS